ncbi:hypothetical protein KM043_010064 [Ampulex compressa]|nr:hypothetical protein KM043_010064 [Ampulex compressa]
MSERPNIPGRSHVTETGRRDSSEDLNSYRCRLKYIRPHLSSHSPSQLHDDGEDGLAPHNRDADTYSDCDENANVCRDYDKDTAPPCATALCDDDDHGEYVGHCTGCNKNDEQLRTLAKLAIPGSFAPLASTLKRKREIQKLDVMIC